MRNHLPNMAIGSSKSWVLTQPSRDVGLRQANQENLPAVVVMADGLEEFYARHGFVKLVGYVPAGDMVVQEKGLDGEMVERRFMNPLKQRGFDGGGVAWTRIEADR